MKTRSVELLGIRFAVAALASIAMVLICQRAFAQSAASAPPLVPRAASAASGAASEPKGTGAVKCPSGASEEVCKAYQSGDCPPTLELALCTAKVQDAKPFPQKLWKWLDDSGVLKALLGLLSAGLLLVITKLRGTVSTLAARLGDPMIQGAEKRTFRTRGVNLVIVGEGGTGKTSLIRALSGSRRAAPSRSTAFQSTYCIVHEVDIEPAEDRPDRLLERIYANDYQGQLTGQLVNIPELAEREKAIKSTVLVIVVDLFPSLGAIGPRQQAKAEWDAQRVQMNLDAYSNTMLQLIFAIPKELKRIILFINKVDLLIPYNPDTESKILAAYDVLIQRLNTRGRQFEVNVVLGAASKGTGIVGFEPKNSDNPTLYELLKDSMVEIDLKQARAIRSGG